MQSGLGDAEPVGSSPARLGIAATLFVGVVGILFAGVGPLLLGALEGAGRLSARQIGLAGTVELLTMGVAAGTTGALVGNRRLRQLAIMAGISLALADMLSMRAEGGVLVAVRALAGVPSGALVWLTTALIVRMPKPERWAAVYFTVQTLAQFLVVAALGAWVLRPFGPAGGFAALAGLAAVAAAAGLLVPRGFERLPTASGEPSGLPAPLGLFALVAVLAFNASILALWIYVDPLSRQAGHPQGTSELAFSLSLGAQVVAGIAATVLAGRVRWLPALLGAQAVMASLLLLFAQLPPADVFLAGSALFGALWMFAAPFLTPFVIAADPTRRAAVLGSGAALLGCSAGPLAASLVVTEGDARGSAWLGLSLMLVAIAIVVVVRFRLPAIADRIVE